nr:hypothetical protein [uncultured Psychroserpens sp.]
MKYIYILISLLFFSCGNVTPKHKFSIIYEFENLKKLSANDKQGVIEVLNKRLDQFASTYTVTLNNKQQILVNLSSDFNLGRVNAIITNTGKLDFWPVIKAQEIGDFLIKANNFYKKDDNTKNPLIDLIQANAYSYAGLFSVASKDTLTIRRLLENKEVKQMLPMSIRQSKFLFGLPEEDGFLPLYLVKTTTNNVALVNETHITDARQTYSSTNRPTVSMSMNKKGADRWERMTEQAYLQQSQIAITLDDIVYSAPTVSSGAIKGGKTEITGGFNLEQAQELALIFGSKNRIPKLKFVDYSPITD